MKDKFIRFLKDHQAFDEYKEEIKPYTFEQVCNNFDDGGEEFMLQDGSMFFWKDAVTFVDWATLDKEWKEICFAERRNKRASNA